MAAPPLTPPGSLLPDEQSAAPCSEQATRDREGERDHHRTKDAGAGLAEGTHQGAAQTGLLRVVGSYGRDALRGTMLRELFSALSVLGERKRRKSRCRGDGGDGRHSPGDDCMSFHFYSFPRRKPAGSCSFTCKPIAAGPVFVPVARYFGKASGNVRTVEGHPNSW